jgi:hypothetical protein
VIIEALQERFGGVDSGEIKKRVTEITSEEILSKLFRKSLRTNSIKEFKEEIKKI